MTMKQLSSHQFALGLKAISAGRPQVYKNGGVGDTKQYRHFKQKIETIIERDLSPMAIQEIMDDIAEGNGYKVHIVCYYQRANPDFWNTPMLVYPDVDNIEKGLFDQVLGRFGLDDSRIFSATIDKLYGKENKTVFFVDTYEVPEYKGVKPKTTRRKKKKKLNGEELKEIQETVAKAKKGTANKKGGLSDG